MGEVIHLINLGGEVVIVVREENESTELSEEKGDNERCQDDGTGASSGAT